MLYLIVIVIILVALIILINKYKNKYHQLYADRHNAFEGFIDTKNSQITNNDINLFNNKNDDDEPSSHQIVFGECEKGERGDKGPRGPIGPKGIKGQVGKQGYQGYASEHRWVDDTKIQYKIDEETWSKPYELRGKKGKKGDIREHKWENNTLYLECDRKKKDDGTYEIEWCPPIPLQQIIERKGLKGPRGSQGPQGLRGIKGIKGIMGPAGILGEAGPQGSQGDKGEQGDEGPVGITGPTGPRGVIGYTGPMGKKGPLGTGGKGPRGDVGIPGRKGRPGLKGPPGKDLTYTVRGQTGIIGETGPKGDQGDVGLLGNQGVQGERGNRGIAGNPGIIGPQGFAGPVGDRGDTGEQGGKGPRGVMGDVGVKGPDGPIGDIGITGPTGPKGDKGDDSTQAGPSGVRGDKGPSGDPGANGPNGPPGRSVNWETDNNSVYIKENIGINKQNPKHPLDVKGNIIGTRFFKGNKQLDILGGPDKVIYCRFNIKGEKLLSSNDWNLEKLVDKNIYKINFTPPLAYKPVILFSEMSHMPLVLSSNNNYIIIQASKEKNIAIKQNNVLNNGVNGTFQINPNDSNSDIAKKACESVNGIGNCVKGKCGGFNYWYKSGDKNCSCSKSVGKYEWIYAPYGNYTQTYHDYDSAPYSKDFTKMDGFLRKKIRWGCNSSGSWELVQSYDPEKSAQSKPLLDDSLIIDFSIMGSQSMILNNETCDIDYDMYQGINGDVAGYAGKFSNYSMNAKTSDTNMKSCAASCLKSSDCKGFSIKNINNCNGECFHYEGNNDNLNAVSDNNYISYLKSINLEEAEDNL